MSSNPAAVDQAIKNSQLQGKYPKVGYVVVKGEKQWDTLSDSQLATLESILSRYDDFAELVSRSDKNHPTLSEILILNNYPEGVARLYHYLKHSNQYQPLTTLLCQPNIRVLDEVPQDNMRLSSAIFIATIQLSQAKLDELNHLVNSCEAVWLEVFQNRLRLEDLFNLTPVQRATLNNKTIQNLMTQSLGASLASKPPLTVQRALQLTAEQVTHLTQGGIYNGLMDGTLPNVDFALGIDSKLSAQQIKTELMPRLVIAAAIKQAQPNLTEEQCSKIAFLPSHVWTGLQRNSDQAKANALLNQVLALPQAQYNLLASKGSFWHGLCFQHNALPLDYLLQINESHSRYLQQIYANDTMKAAIYAGRFPELYNAAHPNAGAPQANHAIQKIRNDLKEYMDRFDHPKTPQPNKFEAGFWVMKKSRAANREANYELVKNLRDQLEQFENCDKADIPKHLSDIFTPACIKQLRPAVSKGNPDRGINSRTVNRIIRGARKIGAEYKPPAYIMI